MSEYDEKTDHALDVVAVMYACNLMIRHADLDDDWEDYPDLGMYDFIEVVERVKKMAGEVGPTTEEYKAAYDHLKSRSRSMDPKTGGGVSSEVDTPLPPMIDGGAAAPPADLAGVATPSAAVSATTTAAPSSWETVEVVVVDEGPRVFEFEGDEHEQVWMDRP